MLAPAFENGAREGLPLERFLGLGRDAGQVAQRGQDVDGLGNQVEAPTARHPSARDEERHMADLGVDRPIARVLVVDVRLAGAVVFAQGRAVVRRDRHDGVLPQLQVVDFLEHPAQPAVHQLRLGRVVGPQVAQFPVRVGRGRTIVGVNHGRAFVVGVVAADHVLGRVPGLVRVEEVHPQEERAGVAVILEPAHGRVGRTRRESIGLVSPVAVRPAMHVGQRMIAEPGACARLGVG